MSGIVDDTDKALTYSGKWHIIDPNTVTPHKRRRYEIALCGAYLERNDSPNYPEHLQKIKDGTRKSTGLCKSCLRITGVKTITIKLPQPNWRKAATQDENGAAGWEYRDGEVIVYDDGSVEWRPFGFYGITNSGYRLRDAAAALLAAADAADAAEKGVV